MLHVARREETMREQLGYATIAVLGTLTLGPRFGLDIMRQTGLPSGTVYPTLARAERAGFVRGRWEARAVADSEARPRRRHYQLTGAGEVALARAAKRMSDLTGPVHAALKKVRS
jgi:PadR family transcriptional regulator, regulatory protein PadR